MKDAKNAWIRVQNWVVNADDIKITPTIEMMIEAAVKEMDIQNEKINAELKKD